MATGIWALQQPLDQRVFRVPYDDVELLGKAVTRGPGWRPAGTAMHLANGAIFGALYASARDRLPGPPALRGPAAAFAECVGTWPMVAITDRIHPARGEMPRLWGSRAAFAQAIWRHLLFGAVLGELERRLNPAVEEEDEPGPIEYSSNGHGDLSRAVSAGPA